MPDRRHEPIVDPRLTIVGILLLGIVLLWVGLVAFDVVKIDLIGERAEKASHTLDTTKPVITPTTDGDALVLTILHTNDTLGYVDPCA